MEAPRRRWLSSASCPKVLYWIRDCSFYTWRTSQMWLRHTMLTSIPMSTVGIGMECHQLLWVGSNYGSASLGSSGLPIQLGNEIITASNHVRLLGVIISSDLNPEKHTSVIVSSCFYWLRQLRRVRQSLDIESAKTILLFMLSTRLLSMLVTPCWPSPQRTLLTGFSA